MFDQLIGKNVVLAFNQGFAHGKLVEVDEKYCKLLDNKDRIIVVNKFWVERMEER